MNAVVASGRPRKRCRSVVAASHWCIAGRALCPQQSAKASTNSVAPVQMEDRLKRSVACVARVADGGRRRKIEEDPQLLVALQALVEPSTRGDPESALRWTCKSLRVLAWELVRLGHTVSYRTVGRLLKCLDYRLQANRKTLEACTAC